MRRSAAAACLLASVAAALPSSSADAGSRPPTVDDGLYVVVLRAPPAAVFAGRPGVEGSAPTPGHRFRPGRAEVRAYTDILAREQQRVIDEIDATTVVYSYRIALNGFAAELTSDQVKSLVANPDVVAVEASETVRLDDIASTVGALADRQRDLGLPHEGSAWRQVGGVGKAGRGTVVGVIDSGIWPDNPSFAGLPLDRAYLHRAYPGFTGSCEPGDRWSESACNTKIVAARFFVDGFGADNISSAEMVSPRDATGHGSHVAAIAAGNAGVDVTIGRQRFGHMSGVAPNAGLAIYKACWAAPDPADDGCTTADTLAAIDQAVSDGVDVLNFSASGPPHGGLDAVDLAFLGAASAGVFVTAPAGNRGPTAGTVSHASPWVTTAGASTATLYQGGVRLGNGRLVIGSMVSDQGVLRAPLVDARSAGTRQATKAAARLCAPGALDASAVAGAIVVCERGEIARVSKSEAVEQAGGVGMVLVNDTVESTDTDAHAVPTVHVTMADGRTIRAYLAAAAHPTAALDPDARDNTPRRQLADFSSRGPALDEGGDLVKPDVTAPGVSIVSAVAPPADGGRLWNLASGTSMSAAQVAGLGALVRGAHPLWSAALVKSAVMTTAAMLARDPGPLARGAGDIRADRAVDPGLAFPAARRDWIRYARAADPRLGNLWGTSSGDASDLNQAAIAIGSLVGSQNVVRRVTNVSGAPETYTAEIRGLSGIAARVTPSTLRLARGETARFRVTLTAQRAAEYGTFATGELRWTGTAGHVATIPMVVRPETLDVPAEVAASGNAGQVEIHGTAGVTGVLRIAPVALAAAQPVSLTITAGPFDSRRPEASTAAARTFTVGARTAVARFEAGAPAGSDLDLYVYRDGRLLAASASPSSREVVTLERPMAGDYDVYVASPAPGAFDGGDDVTAIFTGWVVPATGRADVEVDRRIPATGGRRVAIPVAWTGLSDSQRWFGEVRYRGTSRVTHLTIN